MHYKNKLYRFCSWCSIEITATLYCGIEGYPDYPDIRNPSSFHKSLNPRPTHLRAADVYPRIHTGVVPVIESQGLSLFETIFFNNNVCADVRLSSPQVAYVSRQNRCYLTER
jgi:hypothetical protein